VPTLNKSAEVKMDKTPDLKNFDLLRNSGLLLFPFGIYEKQLDI
jgi:hypothetical protein